MSTPPESSLPSTTSSDVILSPQEAIIRLLERVWLQPCLSPMEKSLWGQEVESQARRFQYLKPSASSLVAMHMSFQGERGISSKLRADAIQFNIEASTLFCGSQPQITEENWLAVMIFGIGILIFHFATAMSSPSQDLKYVELFHLLRHTHTLHRAVGPYFQKSQLKMFVDHRQSLFKHTLDEDTRQAVQRLDDIQYTNDTPEGTRQACQHAISALQDWVRETDGHPRTWIHLITWQGAVTDEFAELISARHPVALLVFVYWCTVMRRIPKRWFLERLWERTAYAAMMELPDTWDDMLEWPREALFTSSSGVDRAEEMA